MGYGNYSHDAHQALLQSRAGTPAERVFQQRKCHPLMDPKGVRVRESRDSAEHPASIPIVFALDVTGSMGEIPKMLATQTLPDFMNVLQRCKVNDPQLLFCAVGDAYYDNAPLQVGQFESTAELMDQWLTWSFLEGGGGGTGQESYELAMYFLAQHIDMDCKSKRNRRGYLFLTGDEMPYPTLSRHIVEAMTGDRLDDDVKTEEVVALLQESFVPYFVIPTPERRAKCEARWRQLLGDHVLCLDRPEHVCHAAAGAILIQERLVTDAKALEKVLVDAGASQGQVKGTLRALEPLFKDPPRSSPPAGAAAPSLLKRLFKM
jgi:hypothetical protein